MDKAYDRFLTDRDREVLEVYGYDNAMGGGERPAVLVVDATYAFVGETREPTAEASKKRRTACGERAWIAVDRLSDVLNAARAAGVPVIYTRGSQRPDLERLGAASLKKKRRIPHVSANLRDGNDIVDEIAPGPGDIVITKDKPSAFFGTPLLSYLIALKIDGLLIAGGATSGCVRASVVDAFSNNYACTLIEDCCFDRFEASHAMTIFDLGAKYAAIRDSSDVVSQIRSLSSGRATQ